MKHPMERVLLVFVTWVAIAGGHAHAAALWNADWYSSAPPTLNLYGPTSNSGLAGKPSTAVAFSAQGDILFGAMAVSAYDYQFMRMGSDGTPNWVSNVYDDATSQGGAYSLWPADDGSALLALNASLDYGDAYDRLVKLSSSGTQLWSRAIPSAWTVPVATDRIATAGCSRLSLVDSTNGNVLWQRTLVTRRDYCTSGGLVADAQANLYVLVEIGNDYYDVTGFRAQKFDIDGNPLWDVATDAPQGASAAAVTGDTLYVVTQQELRALHTGDGSLAWSIAVDAFAKVLISDDPAHDPIIVESDQVQRVQAATGQLLWATPLANTTKVTRVTQGALLVATTDGRAKLDLATGAIAWNVANSEDPDHVPTWLGFGDVANGSFAAVALQYRTASTAPALIKRIDFANGAIAADLAPSDVAQGITGAAYADGGDDIVNVGISADSTHPILHLRRLDAATGAVRWEIADAIDEIPFAAHSPQPRIEAELATDTIAVVAPITQLACYGGTAVTGAARVSLYERATGMRRWRAALGDSDQQCTYASAPHIDAQGNVFVSVSALIVCPNGISCQRRTLYKLRAADGSVAWRKDESTDAGIEGLVLYPTEVTVFGNDVVFVGWMHDAPGAVHRLSGVDGSVQWSFDVDSSGVVGEQIDKLDEHHLVVHSDDNTNMVWTKLDADTGSALWSSSAPFTPCWNPFGCASGAPSRTLPDGNVLWAGQREYKANLRRLHNDGSGLIDDWSVPQANANLNSYFSQTTLDPAGALHVLMRRGDRIARGSISFFGEFDLANGKLLGQQALYSYRGDRTNEGVYPSLLSMPAVNRVLAGTYAVHSPDPTTNGAMLLDTTVLAHGDLAFTAAVDAAQVAPGMVLGVHANASYSGDQPIAGATFSLNLPWQSGITELVCHVQNASNCVLDSRAGNVYATFDAMPGASVEIAGKVLVLDIATAPIVYAFGYGPVGLSEQDTDNNFARATPTQSLFFDGFDGSH